MSRFRPLIAMSSVLMLVLVTGALTAQEAKPGAAQPPPATPTVKAECSMRIRWDPRIRLPDIHHFLLTQSATKDAAKKHLNLAKPPHVGVTTRQLGDGTIELTLEVFVPPAGQQGARHAAAEFADAIVTALPDQLRAYQEDFVAREVASAKEQLERAANRFANAHAEVSHLRKRLRERTGRADATENWGEAISALEQERQKLALDAAGQQARRRAIEETIAKITKGAEQRAKEDEIAQELAKIVALREEELQRAKQLVTVGRINEADLANYGAKLAEARAKLLERRELSARSAGGELLGEFNRELLMLSINAAESEARLKMIQETLDKFHDSASDVDALKQGEKELAAQQTVRRAAEQRFEQTEDRFRDVPGPVVTLLDCDHVTLEAWLKENPN